MPTYISLLKYTDQGIRNIKESPNRADAARKMLQDMGGDIKEIYLTMGEYDLVVICEAPDAETMTKFVLGLASAGNSRTTTLTAFPEADYRKLIGELP